MLAFYLCFKAVRQGGILAKTKISQYHHHNPLLRIITINRNKTQRLPLHFSEQFEESRADIKYLYGNVLALKNSSCDINVNARRVLQNASVKAHLHHRLINHAIVNKTDKMSKKKALINSDCLKSNRGNRTIFEEKKRLGTLSL